MSNIIFVLFSISRSVDMKLLAELYTLVQRYQTAKLARLLGLDGNVEHATAVSGVKRVKKICVLAWVEHTLAPKETKADLLISGGEMGIVQ